VFSDHLFHAGCRINQTWRRKGSDSPARKQAYERQELFFQDGQGGNPSYVAAVKENKEPRGENRGQAPSGLPMSLGLAPTLVLHRAAPFTSSSLQNTLEEITAHSELGTAVSPHSHRRARRRPSCLKGLLYRPAPPALSTHSYQGACAKWKTSLQFLSSLSSIATYRLSRGHEFLCLQSSTFIFRILCKIWTMFSPLTAWKAIAFLREKNKTKKQEDTGRFQRKKDTSKAHESSPLTDVPPHHELIIWRWVIELIATEDDSGITHGKPLWCYPVFTDRNCFTSSNIKFCFNSVSCLVNRRYWLSFSCNRVGFSFTVSGMMLYLDFRRKTV